VKLCLVLYCLNYPHFTLIQFNHDCFVWIWWKHSFWSLIWLSCGCRYINLFWIIIIIIIKIITAEEVDVYSIAITVFLKLFLGSSGKKKKLEWSSYLIRKHCLWPLHIVTLCASNKLCTLQPPPSRFTLRYGEMLIVFTKVNPKSVEGERGEVRFGGTICNEISRN